MRLSNSKAKTFRRCQKSYDFKYVRKLRPRKRSRPLELGSWVHDLLQHYYDGQDWLKRHKVLEAEFNNLFEEEREELGDLPSDALRLMRSYLRTYKGDRSQYRIIDTEVDELVTLPNGDEFNFIIDLVVEDLTLGGIWLWDHKNVTKFLPPDFLMIDTQLTRYHWAAKKLERFKGHNILGVCFNEIRTKAPTVPAVLKDGSLTRRQNQDTDLTTFLWAMKYLDERELSWEEKVEFYKPTLRRIKSQQEGRFFRRTFMPKDPVTTKIMMKDLMVTADEIREAEDRGYFPRSPDKACTWCDYLELCQVELMGADTSNTIKLKYTRKRKEEEVEADDKPEKVLKEVA